MSDVSELEKKAEHISRKISSVKRMPNGMSDKDGSLYCSRRDMTAFFPGGVNRRSRDSRLIQALFPVLPTSRLG
jgi:hypothetical protein